jgi:amino acid transporter
MAQSPIGSDGTVRMLQVLTFWDLVVYGLVYVAPVGPWSTWGFADQLSGGAVSLVYLLGASALMFTAVSYSTMCAEVPDAGSVYSYAGVSMGDTAGFLAGWMILLDYLLLPALMYVFCGASLATVIPTLPKWVWILLVAAYCIGVNWFGIKMSARFNLGTLLLQFILLIVGLGAALWVMNRSGTAVFTPVAWSGGESTTLSGVFAATSLCVMAYLGFDATTTLASEVRPDQRHLVGRAVIFSLALLGIMAVFNVWILKDLAKGFTSTSGDPTTFTFDLFTARVGSGFGQVTALAMVLVVAISITPPMIIGVARVLYAMAQKGEMPSGFGRLNERFRVPRIAMAVSSLLSIAVAIYFADHFDTLTSMVNFGALSAFATVNASVIALFVVKRRSRRYGLHLLVPLIGIAAILMVLSSLSATGLGVGVSWLVAGVVLHLILRSRAAAKAASHKTMFPHQSN